MRAPDMPEGFEELPVEDEAPATRLRLVELKAGEPAGKPAKADWEKTLAKAIKEMNARYFVAPQDGHTLICSLVADEALGRERLVFSRPQDIKLLYANRPVQVAVTKKGSAIWRDLATAWIEHRRRRTYERMALLPNAAAPHGTYNLWRGWGLEPKAGDWPRLRKHLLRVVCRNDKKHFGYLVKWCATCVQHPERHAEVATVLRGKKGAGKGVVARVLMRIFRSHAIQVFHARHLTGNFNAHLVDTLLLVVDEAFWAGDKQGEGVLKGYITEPSIPIEPKGVNVFFVPNRLKLLILSNNDWVVPVTEEERRFFVLDVSDTRCGDLAYFKRLHAALDAGELAAFFHYLLELDLGGFDIRAVPHTEGLGRQKIIGADSVTAFWYDCLRSGTIVGTGKPDWPKSVVTQVLHAAYLDHAQDHGERHPFTDARMVRRLEELWPDGKVRQIRPWTDPDNLEGRPRRYALSDLDKHRAAFLAAMRIDPAGHEWPGVEDGANA